MIKKIKYETERTVYCCDLCGEESKDLMSSCDKCKKHICHECSDSYSSSLIIYNEMWYHLCKTCVEPISHLKIEQEQLEDRLWDIDNEVEKILFGGGEAS